MTTSYVGMGRRAGVAFAAVVMLALALALASPAQAATGDISTYAGGIATGPAPAVSVAVTPAGLAIRGSLVYMGDFTAVGGVVRVLDTATGTERVVAGTGQNGFGGDGAAATTAQIRIPASLTFDRSGDLLIADFFDHRIRKVDAAGIITTIAGTGVAGGSGDGGLATSAQLYNPAAVVLDSAGDVLVAEASGRIRKITPAGIITTIAGTGVAGFSGDGGPATSAQLNDPQGVAVDAADNVYIADGLNYRIRKVDHASGLISTVAGSGTVPGFSGDGGLATSATLFDPNSPVLDSGGNLLFSDSTNHRIRRVDATTGIISTVAGSGPTGYNAGAFAGDGGAATAARFNRPGAVALDGAGDMFISDGGNYRLRRVDAVTGIVTTVAGNGTESFSGDGGPATSAQLGQFGPRGVAVDASGSFLAVRLS